MMSRLQEADTEVEAIQIIAKFVPKVIRALVFRRGYYLFAGLKRKDENKFEHLMKKYNVEPKPDMAYAQGDDFLRITPDGWRKK